MQDKLRSLAAALPVYSVAALVGELVGREPQGWLLAILSGAIVQLIYLLVRNYFGERRDLLQEWKRMREDMRAYYQEQIANERNAKLDERRQKHELANRLYTAEMKLELIAQGLTLEEIEERLRRLRVVPIYDEQENKTDS